MRSEFSIDKKRIKKSSLEEVTSDFSFILSAYLEDCREYTRFLLREEANKLVDAQEDVEALVEEAFTKVSSSGAFVDLIGQWRCWEC